MENSLRHFTVALLLLLLLEVLDASIMNFVQTTSEVSHYRVRRKAFAGHGRTLAQMMNPLEAIAETSFISLNGSYKEADEEYADEDDEESNSKPEGWEEDQEGGDEDDHRDTDDPEETSNAKPKSPGDDEPRKENVSKEAKKLVQQVGHVPRQIEAPNEPSLIYGNHSNTCHKLDCQSVVKQDSEERHRGCDLHVVCAECNTFNEPSAIGKNWMLQEHWSSLGEGWVPTKDRESVIISENHERKLTIDWQSAKPMATDLCAPDEKQMAEGLQSIWNTGDVPKFPVFTTVTMEIAVVHKIALKRTKIKRKLEKDHNKIKGQLQSFSFRTEFEDGYQGNVLQEAFSRKDVGRPLCLRKNGLISGHTTGGQIVYLSSSFALAKANTQIKNVKKFQLTYICQDSQCDLGHYQIYVRFVCGPVTANSIKNEETILKAQENPVKTEDKNKQKLIRLAEAFDSGNRRDNLSGNALSQIKYQQRIFGQRVVPHASQFPTPTLANRLQGGLQNITGFHHGMQMYLPHQNAPSAESTIEYGGIPLEQAILVRPQDHYGNPSLHNILAQEAVNESGIYAMPKYAIIVLCVVGGLILLLALFLSIRR